MFEAAGDPRIRRILSADDADRAWETALARLAEEEGRYDRDSAGEAEIRSLQRLMVFLGHSTMASGAFAIDGDFGCGTNRGVAQFQVEHGLAAPVTESDLCYPCVFNNARRRITAIPNTRLDARTADAMLVEAQSRIADGRVTFGSFEEAIFHLDALERRRSLDCREVQERYGGAADRASAATPGDSRRAVQHGWILAIIRQEMGVQRPEAMLPDDLKKIRHRLEEPDLP